MEWIPRVGLGEVLVVGLVMLIFGLVGALLMGIGWFNHRRAQASRAWPMVLGRVTHSGVRQSTDSDGGTTYSPDVRYMYDVGGRAFENGRLLFGGTVDSSSYRPAEKTAARYAAGSVVQVYYNPTNPQDAVLERRSGITRFMLLFGGFFVVLGCGLFGCAAAAYVARLVT
jgi:hypothetical protein